jgi:hypothetical protein
VADTGNNLVRLFAFTKDDPTPVWNGMTNHVVTGDISGAASYFSVVSADGYLNMIRSGGSNAISAISQIGTLMPVYIHDEEAEYYFTNMVNGQVIIFPVKFDKENGVWKVLEF